MSKLAFEVKSVSGQVLYVYDDKIELAGAVGNYLSKRLEGRKTWYYKDITSVQFKNCGWTAGFFEFTFGGGIDNKRGGPISGLTNENRFTFGAPSIGLAKEKAAEMEKVNDYIQRKLAEAKRSVIASTNVPFSSADEIMKYKNLLDAGIITKAEFERKKKQLLDL